jgi:outer membrane protein OmpA-like peptidoglycan-associated protein
MHGERAQGHCARCFRAALATVVLIGSAALLAACAGRSSESLEEARAAVAMARADQEVLAQAPEQLAEAEQALDRAEGAFRGGADQDEVDHLAYLAEQRAGIAQALAHERVALAEMEQLGEQRDALLVEAREREIRTLQTELAELQADRTERGLVVTLSDEILFDVDEAELKPGGMQRLARVAEFLRQNPDRNVLIEGHTDSTAPDDYNLTLSQRRANAVEDFLIAQGVDPTRISATGYGERQPIATNDTVAGRQANRRVEIVVLNAGAPIPQPRAALQ